MLQNQSSVDEQVYVTNVQFTCRSNMHELYARISEGVQLSVTQQTLEVASWHKVESRVEFKQEDEVGTRVTNAVSSTVPVASVRRRMRISNNSI